jgi:hypothetical protein
VQKNFGAQGCGRLHRQVARLRANECKCGAQIGGSRARAAATTVAERVPPLSFDAAFVRRERRACIAEPLMTVAGGVCCGPQHPPRTKAERVSGGAEALLVHHVEAQTTVEFNVARQLR